MPEDRRHGRFAPRITIGKTQSRVVRHIDEGFAVEFTRLQHPDFIEDTVTANKVSGR